MAGEYVALERGGQTFSGYSWGNGDETVLCLHGFPDTYNTFNHQVDYLTRQGFQVVTPVMRGYESSSISARGDYYVQNLAEDVLGWLEALDLERVHLVGHDWGAVAAGAACALAPDRIGTLSLLSVPFGKDLFKSLRVKPSQLINSWYMLFFQLGRFSEEVVAKNGLEFVERLWRDWSPNWEFPPEQLGAAKQALEAPGVLEAALGYYRCAFQFWRPQTRESLRLLLSNVEVPTLGLTGAEDGCIGPEFFRECMSEDVFSKGLSVKTIPNAGHFLHQQAPELVNEELLRWIRKNPLT